MEPEIGGTISGKNSTLIAHCGASLVDYEKLLEVPTPEPSGRWCPIPHHVAFDMLKAALMAAGANIVAEGHALQGENGERYFGLLEIEDTEDTDGCTVAGLRKSHDKTIRTDLAFGKSMFVCDNMSFSGTVQIGRRHTTNYMRDLPGLIEAGVAGLRHHAKVQRERIAAYKAACLYSPTSPWKLLGGNPTLDAADVVSHAIVRGFEAKAFPWRDGEKILETWRDDDRWGSDPTVWRFFNAVTYVAKCRGTSVFTTLDRTQELHKVCDRIAGYTVPALPEIVA